MDFGDSVTTIETQTCKIAEEFRAEPQQVTEAIRQCMNLPSLRSQQPDFCVEYASRFLEAACRELGWENTAELLTESLSSLEARFWAVHYLTGTDQEYRPPLFRRDELADQLVEFSEFLQSERQCLLTMGVPSATFPSCHWLWLNLGRLYPTRVDAHLATWEGANGPVEASRRGVRVVRVPNGLGIIRSDCQFDEADQIAGLSTTDAERLIQLRESLFKVKLTVIDRAIQGLRSQNPYDLWDVCFPLFTAELTADDMLFLINVDRIYTEKSVASSNLDAVFACLLGHYPAFNPGGYSNLIELIEHVEKERTIGTMHRTREALGGLFDNLDEFKGPFTYFTIIGGDDRVMIDNAIDCFIECDNREVEFAKQFNRRVASTIQSEFAGNSPRSFAHELQLNIQTFAASSGDLRDLGDRLRAIEAMSPNVGCEPQPIANVFRRRGADWEIQFRNGPLNRYADLDGLFYLSRLIQLQGKEVPPIDLRFAKTAYMATGRLVTGADVASADELVFLHDAGEMIDPDVRPNYAARLLAIESELDDARLLKNEQDIAKLEQECEAILAEVKASKGLGGKTIRLSPESKKAGDAVRNAIDRALAAIKRKDSILHRHLYSSIRRGALWQYAPEETTLWVDH